MRGEKKSRETDEEILTLLQLLLTQIPQLVHLWAAPRRHALCKLHKSSHGRAAADSVLRGLGSDLDDTDSWVLWATIVLSITEVTNPCLERWRVVLSDLLTVGLNAGLAGDGSPFAGGCEECQADLWVGLEVIGLS